jgi:hypothetical protein
MKIKNTFFNYLLFCQLAIFAKLRKEDLIKLQVPSLSNQVFQARAQVQQN